MKAHPRSAYVKTDGTAVSAARVKATCRLRTKVYDFWSKRLIDGRPEGWPYKGERTGDWTEAERERFFAAVEGLPEMLQVPSLKAIYRMIESTYRPNPATHASGILVLYDLAFSPKTNLTRILVHEFAHEVFDSSSSDRKSYMEALGWNAKWQADKVFWTGRAAGFVADDGHFEPDEDFANNVEFYLFEPKKLLEVTPVAYRWIEKRYGDKLKLVGGTK